MQAVLGIDAAWTSINPSGIALVAQTESGWRLLVLESSYQRFYDHADNCLSPDLLPTGSLPSATLLLKACEKLYHRQVSLVAIDMPLSHAPITGRRFSDDAVSKAYGSRACSTHTPSASRPGLISDQLREGFMREGYPLLTGPFSGRGLIEVYPHPALVELTGAPYRLPYKASKVSKYWPKCSASERRAALYGEWRKIVANLDARIAGVAAALPELEARASGSQVKAFEDKLDAVVCAWVAICALEGKAAPLGDHQSAVWIPVPTEVPAVAPNAALTSEPESGSDLSPAPITESGQDPLRAA